MKYYFDELTTEEQQQLLLDKVTEMAQQVFSEKAVITWLAYTHNAVFKIVHDDQQYTVKVNFSDRHRGLYREALLLQYLSQSKTFKVPRPLTMSEVESDYPPDGKAIFTPDLELRFSSNILGSHHQETTIVYHYLEGKALSADVVTDDEMRTIGVFLANFHQSDLTKRDAIESGAKHWIPSHGNLDWNGLFGMKGRYQLDAEAQQVLTNEQLTVMDAAAKKVKAAMDELGTGETEFGLIHGDLLLQNILFHEGEVRALDFEYCGWGYYLYDLTPLLWQLKPQARYPELEQALWDGYTSIRPLSSRHRELLETFIAGRQVASMRWVAANRHNPAYQGKVEGIMVQRAAELRGFLETGILKRG